MVKLAMELRDPRRKVGCFRAVICSFSAENNGISDISRSRPAAALEDVLCPATLISHIKTRKSDVAMLIPVQAAHQNGMMPPAVTE
jgi:hypothetical protein